MLFWQRAILLPCIGERASTLRFEHLYMTLIWQFYKKEAEAETHM
jgi:hypothetical protein